MVSAATERVRSLKRLDQFGLRRSRHGYYYIAHYPPLRAQKELSSAEVEQLISNLDVSAGFETYLHFPFCEIICTFCHFLKEKVPGVAPKEGQLLSAIEKEIEMYADRLGKMPAHSLQIGGGTPSLMSNKGLVRILGVVERHFDFDAGAEKKIELFPKRYDQEELAEKLCILRDHGFTDIVIDLESGNQATLDYIGRGISSLDVYLELVEACVKAGFSSIVSALMMGLPGETFDSLERTLERLTLIPEIKVINTFPTIVRPPDGIFTQYQKHPEDFPNPEQWQSMWVFARNFLRSKGWKEGPISYLHHPDKRPAQQADKFECVNLLGFGPSAFGYWNGPEWAAQCYNPCTQAEYYSRVAEDRLPLWRAGLMDQEERARRKLIFGLANCKTENLHEIERRFDVSVDELFGPILNALLELGLIEMDRSGEGVRYTEDGLCRLEEISYFLGSDDVNYQAEAYPDKSDPQYLQLLRHHYYPTVAAEDRSAWRQYASGFSSSFTSKLAG